MKYICTIESDSTYGREFDVDTKSAMKCAAIYGRCEGGEVIKVSKKSGKLISAVRWSPENGGRYWRSTAWEET